MAFDGIYIRSIINELKETIMNGRIDKIHQPDKNDIILSVRNFGKSNKIRLSINSANPLIGITNKSYENPQTPPMFCMILRKYLSGGRIVDITQPKFDRIINLHIQSLNELGDMSEKILIFEIMGKHSNIILTESNVILDSIKRVTLDKSSVREVLPQRDYVFPPNHNKLNPLLLDKESFIEHLNKNQAMQAQDIIYKCYSGISPIMATEMCLRANVNPSDFIEKLSSNDKVSLAISFQNIMDLTLSNDYKFVVYYNKGFCLEEFSPFEMSLYKDNIKKFFSSPSELIEFFYNERDRTYNLNQKSNDIKRILQSTIERYIKKIDLQKRAIKDTKNMEKFRIRGELIISNIYQISQGMTSLICIDYNDENLKEMEIPLDSNLSPSDNAQKYFKKYNKMKRTKESTEILLEENLKELNYLESIQSSLHAVTDDEDIEDVREELVKLGILKEKKGKKKKIEESKPLHFVSKDGFDIYVGKNNKQNDALTLGFANPDDIWMHTKEIAGSHVIIRSNGKTIPDSTLNDGAMLAAYYSKGKNSSLVPVDYIEKKFVKKPRGAKPGMVIYTTNKTAYVTPEEDYIRELKFNNEL
ncbi:MAG: NFACT family protein [Lachnospirales bacterium]